jgi:signal-transduction protein with cAMP-binding, CBS, and nucleotidyltransferase domain
MCLNSPPYVPLFQDREKMDFCCRLPLFRKMSVQDLEEIVAHMTMQEYARGDVIFLQNTEPTTVCFVMEGTVSAD